MISVAAFFVVTCKTGSGADKEYTPASVSIDPAEKMLGFLRDAKLSAVISPAGEVKSISGFEDIATKILSGTGNDNQYNREMIKNSWMQVIEEGLIKKNMEQLFRMFPDSAVHVGDKWKLNTRQKSEGLDVDVQSFFTFTEIDNGVAVLESEGKMKTDNSAAPALQEGATASLEGEQQGRYETDMNSGMLLKSRIATRIKGFVRVMGMEVPLTVSNKSTIEGKKME